MMGKQLSLLKFFSLCPKYFLRNNIVAPIPHLCVNFLQGFGVISSDIGDLTITPMSLCDIAAVKMFVVSFTDRYIEIYVNVFCCLKTLLLNDSISS